MSCGIYKITNLVNNKVYIGQSVDIERRWRDHRKVYETGNSLVYKAFRKYGLENFSFEIIEQCPQDELNDKEYYWIKYYHSCIYDDKCWGYNMNYGGYFGSIVKTEDILAKWEEGLTVSQIAQSLGINSHSIGKRLGSCGISPTERKQRFEKNKIYQYDLNGNLVNTFHNTFEVERVLGYNHHTISSCLTNRLPGFDNYIWTNDNSPSNILYKIEAYKNGGINRRKAVCQYTLSGEFIAEYISCRQAVKAVGGVAHQHISNCCKGKIPQAYGYIWKYKD